MGEWIVLTRTRVDIAGWGFDPDVWARRRQSEANLGRLPSLPHESVAAPSLLAGIVAIAAAGSPLTAPSVGTAATRAETTSNRAQKARSSAAHIGCGLWG